MKLIPLAALLLPAAALADGSVVSIDGKASVERGKQTMNVVAALPVQPGDTLTVQKQSKVQLQFDDDSLFSIPGAAVLRVDEFSAPEKGPGRAVYTLVDGGLRTITGRVSKDPKDVYELHTDLATVTVKGSAYTALRCRKACVGQKAGLYVKGEKGLITVANGAGKLTLRPGEVAFVESPESAPVRVQNSPFLDPVFASAFKFSEVLEGTGEPPRIEQEPPASPS
jgi:FecR protein